MMHPLPRAAGATLLLFQLACAPAWADTEKKDDAGKVVVNGMRNPELKNYRIMYAGVLAFEEHRAFAPQASMVRFQLRPRKSAGPTPYDGLSLRLAGDQTSIDLPLDPSGSFELPPKDVVTDEDADLVLNKRKGSFSWLPVVRSPGVPEGMRRMGDLRLECEVLIAIVKEELGLWKTALVNTIMLSTDWCMNKRHEGVNIPTFSRRPLASAVLIEGDKRTELKIDGDPTVFTAPLADRSVADDALIELNYAVSAPAP